MSQTDTLRTALEYLIKNNVDDDLLYAHIAPSDSAKVRFHLERFNAILQKTQPAGSRKSKGEWTTQQNRLKGRCFEFMMRALVPRVFQTWQRIQTTTNELDLLLKLGPTSTLFPALREWGAYSICECKSNKDTFSVTWVDKLAGVLDKHAAKVGIVMGTKAPQRRGNGARALDSIRMYAIKDRTIILIDITDVQRCLNGENALRLIVRRYVETRTGIQKFRLLSNN